MQSLSQNKRFIILWLNIKWNRKKGNPVTSCLCDVIYGSNAQYITDEQIQYLYLNDKLVSYRNRWFRGRWWLYRLCRRSCRRCCCRRSRRYKLELRGFSGSVRARNHCEKRRCHLRKNDVLTNLDQDFLKRNWEKKWKNQNNFSLISRFVLTAYVTKQSNDWKEVSNLGTF